jgi:hypothetical protein
MVGCSQFTGEDREGEEGEEGFAGAIEKLQSHLSKTTVWLGDNWHKLLGFVGLKI